MFGLISQMRRASVSIGANLAEGCGRRSEGEMARFIQIAMGSAAELSYHLLVARDLGLIERRKSEALENSVGEVSRMLSALAQRIRQHNNCGPRAER
jgi:four helix bundle protein